MQPSLRPSAAMGRQTTPTAPVALQTAPPASFPAVPPYPPPSVSYAPRAIGGSSSSSSRSPPAVSGVAALNGSVGSLDMSTLSGLASLHLTDTQLSALSASLKLNPYQQLALQQLTQQQRSAASAPPTTASGAASSSSGSALGPPSARSPPPLSTAVDANVSVAAAAGPRPAVVSSFPAASPPVSTSTSAPAHRTSSSSSSSRAHPMPVNSSDLSFPSNSGGSMSAVPPPGSEAARTQAKALLKSAPTRTYITYIHTYIHTPSRG